MSLKNYSSLVLSGLRAGGFTDKEIAAAAGLSNTLLKRTGAGQREFTDRELDGIERLADQNAGWLAYEAVGVKDSAFEAVLKSWNGFRKSASRRQVARSGTSSSSRKRKLASMKSVAAAVLRGA